MNSTRPTALTVALLALLAVMPAAWAHPPHRGKHAEDSERAIVLAQARMSLDQAVAMAEKRFKARVVRAETRQEDGHTFYVLRLLNDSGRVWTIRVDAENGSIH